jgi:hypothetical protein
MHILLDNRTERFVFGVGVVFVVAEFGFEEERFEGAVGAVF